MKLSYEQLKEITWGAVRLEQTPEGIRFWRFTKQQQEAYLPDRPATGMNYYSRTLACSGMRFVFRTDSRTMKLKCLLEKSTSRSFFCFEVFADGKPVGNLDNFGDQTYPEGKPNAQFPLGEYEKEFTLPEGMKTVVVYLPFTICPALQELSLDDGAVLQPVRRAKKLFSFGDSITQGYDAMYPSRHYTAPLADMLDAELVNKGIGGEIFFPTLATLADDTAPDYITVAYGTNDFSKTDGTDFIARAGAFFGALRQNYPNARIFAITPIWRKDYQGKRAFGPFETVAEGIRQAVADIPDVTVIDGFDLVPHDEKFFSDLRLHPNDAGFAHYGENLCREIGQALK